MIKKIKRMVLMIFVSLSILTNYCFGTIADSKLATGTENLIKDITNWLLILAPTVTVLLIGYYLIRKSASDEMDAKRWDSRIKMALICCVGVVVASGLINLIIGYYK